MKKNDEFCKKDLKFDFAYNIIKLNFEVCMNRTKLGNIIMIFGGIAVCVCFILFTLGGFMMASRGPSPLLFIGFFGFAIGGVLCSIGGAIKGSGDIKEIKDSSLLKNMINVAHGLKSEIGSSKCNCAYCGTIYDISEKTCPNCGASNSENK